MYFKQAEFLKSCTKISDCPLPDKPEYAFIGRSNVGKSSLINMLAHNSNLAKTSSTPGKTQTINHFLIENTWYLVDLPGYGYAKTSKVKRFEFSSIIKNYILKRENLVNLFVLIDSRHTPLKNDLDFMEWLGINQVPFSIVFTKSDKLNKAEYAGNFEIYKAELLKTWEYLPDTFITSSFKNTGGEEILTFINNLNKEIKF